MRVRIEDAEGEIVTLEQLERVDGVGLVVVVDQIGVRSRPSGPRIRAHPKESEIVGLLEGELIGAGGRRVEVADVIDRQVVLSEGH